MFEIIRNSWRTVELRKKIFFTLFIILVFRIGSHIPVPFIDFGALAESFNTSTSDAGLLDFMAIFTGGAMQYGALFAMGVTPYINASIIMQLLQVAIPALERMSKEGEEGRKKINKITRYATVFLGLVMGGAYYFYLYSSGFVTAEGLFANIFAAVTIILCFTAGSALVMWMGEQIEKSGVGNGISIILFAGILSRLPSALVMLYEYFIAGSYVFVIGVILLFLAIIVFIVWMYDAERRIPVQYAKRVVGRKMYGGQSSHIPIKVNMSGVMPIIFASSILAVPNTILMFMGQFGASSDGKIYRMLSSLDYRSAFYAILQFAMIIAFAYFYTTIQYNPVEMANNLRKNSGVIPGIRPGKPTSDFIMKILSKITLVGAIFLGILAVLPTVVGAITGVSLSIGGTSLLIVVGVALDTVQKLESQLMMRHYKGFLD